MMPRFFKDMPPAKNGRWVAIVIRTTIQGSREVCRQEVTGLRRAYMLARILALLEDLTTPSFGGEIGINWAVREGSAK